VVRTGDDSWDLKTGVGATATMVAAARAVASKRPAPLVNDPFAAVLVREVGIELFTRIVNGEVDFGDVGAGWFPACFGIRAWLIDKFVADACRAGIRQLVILASGLDCRAYRLDWPAATAVYEVDQPEVIEWKTNTLAGLRAVACAHHRCVGIDLRQDWPVALQLSGFDPARPSAWIAEGLFLGYLPPATHDEILDAITKLSAPGSRIIADYFDTRRPEALGEILDELHDIWSKHDPELSVRSLGFSGVRCDPAVYLAERGWTTRSAGLDEVFQSAGRPSPVSTEFPPAARTQLFATGTRD
jgi:methyltransferase (TIGR00027 family)